MPDCRPPLASPSRPSHALPPGACDAHCHVFGPAAVFPYAEGRSYTPPDAPYEAMAALHARLGVERAVLVQANCHGADHGALLDALARSGGRYRGVALLGAHATGEEVARLHAAGVRAARFNFVPHLGGAPDPAVFDHVVKLIAPLGWHLCLHLDGAMLPGLLPRLTALPLPFVIDHMGRVDTTLGTGQPAFKALLDLARLDNCWIKVSGSERISAYPFDAAVPFAAALVEAIPDRVLWGTDWPHPNLKDHMPDDGLLVDYIPQIATTPELQQRLLVDNPSRLYWPEGE